MPIKQIPNCERWEDVHVQKRRNECIYIIQGRNTVEGRSWTQGQMCSSVQMEGRVNEWFVPVIAACCYIWIQVTPLSPLLMSCSIIVPGQHDTTHSTLSCSSKPLLWWHVITGPWRPSFVVTCIIFKVRNFGVHNEWPLESVQMWFGLLACAVFTSVGLADSMW